MSNDVLLYKNKIIIFYKNLNITTKVVIFLLDGRQKHEYNMVYTQNNFKHYIKKTKSSLHINKAPMSKNKTNTQNN